MPNSRSEGLFGLATLIALGAIGGAWFSELVLHYVPCLLCLWQRWPYYLGLPLAVLGYVLRGRPGVFWRISLLLVPVFVVSAALGAWHAGVEWKLIAAPDCSGTISLTMPSLEDFHKTLGTTRVVLCDEAPLRLLGLSLAGWNMVASAIIATLYGLAARGYGSNSESQ